MTGTFKWTITPPKNLTGSIDVNDPNRGEEVIKQQIFEGLADYIDTDTFITVERIK